MELEALSEKAAEFKSNGASLVIISPQLVQNNREFGAEKKLKVPILSDPGNEIAALYGLRWTLQPDLKALYQKVGIDLPKFNGDESWTLPMPARLIIDPEGIVRHAEIQPDYTIRPDPAETLLVLKELS